MQENSENFLLKHGFKIQETLPQDGTSRSYTRVERNGKTALLMQVPRSENTLPEFLRLGDYLRVNDVRVPDIYEAEPENGLALIEDFGLTPVRIAIERGDDIGALYDKAFSILDHMKSFDALPSLRAYDLDNVHIGRQRVIGWYLPAVTKRIHAKDEIDRYFSVWDEIEKSVPFYKGGFVHGDYHVDNLMLLEDGSLGVIDFQDALYGSPLYDLGNLLEDMRMDVPQDIQNKAKKRLSEEEKVWMRILTTQFHCRLLGQCVRWELVLNKPQYMRFIPRLESYVRDALQDPLLKPLKEYFDDLGLDFKAANTLNAEEAKPYIRPNAF